MQDEPFTLANDPPKRAPEPKPEPPPKPVQRKLLEDLDWHPDQTSLLDLEPPK